MSGADQSSRTPAAATGAVDAADERAIVALINRAAQAADDREYMAWVDLFTDDGEYSVVTLENVETGLYLHRDRGKRALQERAAYHKGIWQVPRGRILHLVSNIVVTVGDTADVAHAKSSFIMTRTADMEHAKLYASGRYADQFERSGERWQFKARRVHLYSNLLPAAFTELI